MWNVTVHRDANRYRSDTAPPHPQSDANNGDNYYIDNKGKIMPIPNSSAHVAVVTGYVDRDFAVKELYTLGVFLQAHPLWDAQIEQIQRDTSQRTGTGSTGWRTYHILRQAREL